ncbi:hypothetical protein HKD37_12G035280 [Glycine soja]
MNSMHFGHHTDRLISSHISHRATPRESMATPSSIMPPNPVVVSVTDDLPSLLDQLTKPPQF